jgi:peptidoglycan-associated lipoprotein
VGIFLVLGVGCGHRSVNGNSHAKKVGTASDGQFERDGVAISGADKSSRGMNAGEDPSGNGASEGGENVLLQGGEFADGMSDEDSLLTEDPLGGTTSPTQSAQDYWAQRRQAEMVTAQAGLQDIFFEFNSWRLTSEAKRILASNAKWMKAHSDSRITIEGHCDERGTRAYNYILGEKRAALTRNYLAALGVSPSQMFVMTYGKDQPMCRDLTDACYQQNRRAHVVLGINVASNLNPE